MTVGVIGAGYWGKNLVRTFHDMGVLAGVVDVSRDTRKILASQYPNVSFYYNYLDLINSGIQAVVVATPAHTHYKIAREALLRGKDVLVEKPLALSLSEAEEIVNLAERKKRILMVGHLLLYQPAICCIKGYLDSGAVGKVAFFCQERLKLGRVRQVENVLWSLGIHDIAVLLYLLGDKPHEVELSGQRVIQRDIEDDIYLHMKFSKDREAHLHVSWLWPEQRRCLTIVGDEGMLVFDEIRQQAVLHKKKITADFECLDEGSEVIYQGKEEPLLLECRHFLDCVINRLKPLSDGRSALDVIEVLEHGAHKLRLRKFKQIE